MYVIASVLIISVTMEGHLMVPYWHTHTHTRMLPYLYKLVMPVDTECCFISSRKRM